VYKISNVEKSKQISFHSNQVFSSKYAPPLLGSSRWILAILFVILIQVLLKPVERLLLRQLIRTSFYMCFSH